MYKAIKNKITYSNEELNNLNNIDFIQHFYSDEELSTFHKNKNNIIIFHIGDAYYIEPILRHNLELLKYDKIYFLGCSKNEKYLKKYEKTHNNYFFINTDEYNFDLNTIKLVSGKNYEIIEKPPDKNSGWDFKYFFSRFFLINIFLEKNNINDFLFIESDIYILNINFLKIFKKNNLENIILFNSKLFVPVIFFCDKICINYIVEKFKYLFKNQNVLCDYVKSICFDINNEGNNERVINDMWIIKGFLNNSKLNIKYIPRMFQGSTLFTYVKTNFKNKISFKNDNYYINDNILYFMHLQGFTKYFVYVIKYILENKKNFILNEIPNNILTLENPLIKNYVTII